jgi:hypothetical protein
MDLTCWFCLNVEPQDFTAMLKHSLDSISALHTVRLAVKKFPDKKLRPSTLDKIPKTHHNPETVPQAPSADLGKEALKATPFRGG